MFLRIENSSGVPITRQVMDQIRVQCATGALSPGERLPSVRALAKDLAVNQNTILKIYERLTGEGLLERRHGDGTYVAGTLSPVTDRSKRELLRGDVERLVQRAQSLGLGGETVRELIETAFAAGPAPAAEKASL
jgi:GntR family transcriptional regulator